jgi:hypothetical protein
MFHEVGKNRGPRMEHKMKRIQNRRSKAGAAGWALLWLLGIPIPILLILFLLRGCT